MTPHLSQRVHRPLERSTGLAPWLAAVTGSEAGLLMEMGPLMTGAPSGVSAWHTTEALLVLGVAHVQGRGVAGACRGCRGSHTQRWNSMSAAAAALCCAMGVRLMVGTKNLCTLAITPSASCACAAEATCEAELRPETADAVSRAAAFPPMQRWWFASPTKGKTCQQQRCVSATNWRARCPLYVLLPLSGLAAHAAVRASTCADDFDTPPL